MRLSSSHSRHRSRRPRVRPDVPGAARGGVDLRRVSRRDRVWRWSPSLTSAIGHLMRRAGGHAAEDAVEAHAARRRAGHRVRRLAADRVVRGPPVHVERPRPDRRDVRIDVGTDDDRRHGVPRLLRCMDKAIFFWRGLTNWLGGMGVIALFVAILPRLAIGGREIFFAEASGPGRRKGGAADPPYRGAAVAALCGADGAADRRARHRRACRCSIRSATRSGPLRRRASHRIRCRSPAIRTRRPSG